MGSLWENNSHHFACIHIQNGNMFSVVYVRPVLLVCWVWQSSRKSWRKELQKLSVTCEIKLQENKLTHLYIFVMEMKSVRAWFTTRIVIEHDLPRVIQASDNLILSASASLINTSRQKSFTFSQISKEFCLLPLKKSWGFDICNFTCQIFRIIRFLHRNKQNTLTKISE